MGDSRFSMREAIGFGWETMKRNIWFFVVLLIVAFLIENLPRFMSDYVAGDFPFISTLLSLSAIVLGLVVQMGLIKVSLKFCDSVRPQFDDLLSSFNLLLKFIGGSLLYGLIVLGGTLLLIVPGVIWALKFSLFPYFMVDEEANPIDALKASSDATDGVKWDLFLFWLLLGLINIAGVLAFVVGLFATIPASMVAHAYVYRTLRGGNDAVNGTATGGKSDFQAFTPEI